jgi:putative PEP-CTERM system TPR-repeat lipoprotein
VREEVKAMLQFDRRDPWPAVAFAVALCAIACPAVAAKDAGPVKGAEQRVTDEDPKATLIALKNAIRKSPQDSALHVKIAILYFQLGEIGSAEREARTARDLKGDEADYLPILIDALLRQRKYKDLYDLVEPGDREAVLEGKVRTALGIAAARLGYDTRAEALLRDAIKLDASAAEPRIQLARYLNKAHPQEADQVIDEAIAAKPQTAELLKEKGDMLSSRGDANGAVRLFREVLKLDPNYQAAHLSRAKVNLAVGDFAAADGDLDFVLKNTPNNFIANYLRGFEYVKQQKYSDADQMFTRIAGAFTAFPYGLYVQGATKFALGQTEAAEGILRQYLSRVPGDPEAARLAASAALRQHGAARAIDYLKPLAEKSPPDAKTLALLGNAYMADSKPQLALQQFEKAAALDPDDNSIKTRVAVAEIGAGQGAEGLEKLEEVFAGGIGEINAGPTLVITELRTGHIEKADEVARSLIDRDAKNPLYQTLLGEVRVAQRDSAAAEAAFRAALSQNPEFPAAARDLAMLYVRSGRIADAKQVYTDLRAKNATDTTALLGLADIAITEKKWPEATELLNRARAAAKYDPVPGLTLVAFYEQRRDWKSAKAVAAELYAQFPRDLSVVVALARTRLESGDTNAAISAYKLAYQLTPDSVLVRSAYVALLKQEKYFRDAWDVLQQAVIQNPQDASLKADLIRVDVEIDGVDGAISRAREFAASDPDNSIYDLVSAEVYEKAGRSSDAVALLEKAATARPADDNLAVGLAQLYTRMGDFGKAEVLLSGRLQADPKNIAASSALAPLYLKIGRPDDAKKIYENVVARKPNDVAALGGLAEIAVGEKQWPEAMEYIKRARDAAPNDPSPGLRLVNLYVLRRDWQNASATAAELADKFPANAAVIDVLGRVQIGAGDREGALSTYQRGREIAPDSLLILSRYVGLLTAAKKFSEAQAVLQAAVGRYPRNLSLKRNLVHIDAEIGGLDAGLAAARGFANSDPDNSFYDLVSAELYEKAGQGGEAAGLLEKAVAAKPSDTDLTIALASVYMRTGVPAKAEAVLKARLKADPKDGAARSALAFFYVEQKRDAAAIAEYSRVVGDHPADAPALNNLAWLYQGQGELGKARELAQRAFAISPEDPRIDGTLGWILFRQGEAGRAMVYLNAANLSDPGDPDIQYHLAVALQNVGRPAEARAMLESLLGSGGSFAERAEAEKLLQELKRG